MPRSLTTSLTALALVAVLTSCNPPGTPQERAGGACAVSIVGDSLTVGAAAFGELGHRFREAGCSPAIDARTGRPTIEGAEVVERWAAEDGLGDILVVALGTNDCSADGFRRAARRILTAAGTDRPVVWVNTWRPVCDATINSALSALQTDVAGSRSDKGNLWVLDHHAWVRDTPEVLAPDGVHLNSSGYRRHAARIVSAVVG
jgi:lysophospholipase L1-like esterase